MKAVFDGQGNACVYDGACNAPGRQLTAQELKDEGLSHEWLTPYQVAADSGRLDEGGEWDFLLPADGATPVTSIMGEVLTGAEALERSRRRANVRVQFRHS